MNRVLEVSRTETATTRLVEDDLAPLADGHVRFRIDRLAITANTVTYANAGDLLGYWDFYPTGDDAWGRTPAMGWAEVIESNHPDIATGGRYYGWYPIAQYVDVAASPTKTGLRDDGDHRSQHAAIYRTFEEAERDPLLVADGEVSDELEDRHSLLRGLFLTGYFAAAFFEANDWFDCEDAVVLSASSKTAMSFAEAAAELGAQRLVGVTSARNLETVTELGRYTSVVTYDDIAGANHDLGRAVVVDLAGNQPVVAALHEQLGDDIGYSMLIGLTHHDQPAAEVASGPTPQWFFAPTALDEVRRQGGDPGELQQRSARALAAFIDGSRDWLRIERCVGPTAAATTWAEVYRGEVLPIIGRIISLHDVDAAES